MYYFLFLKLDAITPAEVGGSLGYITGQSLYLYLLIVWKSKCEQHLLILASGVQSLEKDPLSA